MRKQLLQKGRPLQKPEPSFWILLGILAFSFFLNFWNISQNGTCNEYYAACVKSMTQSWHNFFFVSFDPAGMVSVDKPPVGLWMQALSCKVFGYSGWAMLLPQALSGTLSCLLIYLLTAKYFSKPTGLAAALIFAVTPAVVLVSRNSTMDMQLIFWLLLAVWFLMKSIDTGKWRWLIQCKDAAGLSHCSRSCRYLPDFCKRKGLEAFCGGFACRGGHDWRFLCVDCRSGPDPRLQAALR